MAKEMLINVSEGEECRIAVVENGRLEELYMERTSATSHVGNIYKGRVTNVEPSIQAAFVDFGLGRNGFLHISDLMPTYFGRAGEDVQESVGRKMARRDRPPIQRCLRRGDDLIVQIIKEGIGTKGPTLSTYLSIPGRILVMMPGMSKLGVSRKIEDEEERRRLRKILDELKPPRDSGFIIRTAGVGKSKQDIGKDLQYLTRLWQNVERKLRSGPGPMELYTEGDLVTRTVRDVFTPEIDRVIVDNKDVADHVIDFFKVAMPRTKAQIELHDDPVPLFHKYGIEREIEQMYARHVPLPSGGSLVIDSTEAIVAIDVNSGKFRDHSDAEMTAFKTDLEAADEIPRQLRLRDLGGVIICDFIDLRYERHRRELEKKLHDNLQNDRAKTKMLRMSQFGIIEMTRQRMRPSLKRSIYFDCPHCKGAGLVKTAESMALDVMRRLAIAVHDERVARVDLTVCPEVAQYLQNRKRTALAQLEEGSSKSILIRPDQNMGMDAMNLELWDSRDGLVFIEELGMAVPMAAPRGQGAQKGGRHDHGRQQGRGGRPVSQERGERRDERGRRDGRPDKRGRDERRHGRDRAQEHQGPARRDEAHEPDERFEMEQMEDQIEQREEGLRDESDVMTPEPIEIDEVIAPPPPPMEEYEPAAGADQEQVQDVPFEDVDLSGHDLEGPRDVEVDRSTQPGPPPRAAQEGFEEYRGSARGRRGRRGRGRGRGFDRFPRDGEGSAQPQTPPAEARDEAPVPPPEQAEQTSPPLAPREEQSLPAAEAPSGEQPQSQPASKSRRGRSRGGKSKKPSQQPAAEKKKPTKAKKTSRPSSSRRKKSTQSAAEAGAADATAAANQAQRPAAAARSGSTDRHLMHDEPVLPPPVSRPRTYRDLDHIPDDMD